MAEDKNENKQTPGEDQPAPEGQNSPVEPVAEQAPEPEKRASARQIRAWAKENGYNDVKSRGRIAADVLAAYEANEHVTPEDGLDKDDDES